MIGKTISHYRILEKSGEGGMGVVCKAEDTKLKRTVALKFLPSELTRDEETKKRFIHEAQAASALEHNNICNTHEIDKTEDGQLFISMAYYEGESLKQKIAGERLLPIEEILDIAIQIAQGLTIAHESNIIHRDLKPANIMIIDRGEVKIVDFGLAKLAGQTKLTKEGTTLGTVAYMSPEQARGEEIDHRSDIWSLGVILYEMITGQLPFKGEYDQAVVYSITSEELEPVSGLRTGVPLELERIVKRTLEKDLQDRYQHADDLLSELNHLKKESDSEATSVKIDIPIKKRKSIVLPAIILSIIVLIVAGYLLLKQSLPEKGELPASKWENSIAVLPFKNISADPGQEYFCDGMTDQIISNLAKLQKLKVISRTSVMKYKVTEKTIPEIGKELNVAHVLEGSVQKIGNQLRVTAQLIGTKDDFHIWTEKYDKEYKDLFDIQDDFSKSIASSLLQKLSDEEIAEIKTTRPKNNEAWEYYQRGNYYWDNYDTVEGNEEAIRMYNKAVQADPDFTNAWDNAFNCAQRFSRLVRNRDLAQEKASPCGKINPG